MPHLFAAHALAMIIAQQATRVDFRKGLGALAMLVENTLLLDPFSEQLFVFCRNRSRCGP